MALGEFCGYILFPLLAWCQRLTPSLDADAAKTELAPASPPSETEPDATEDGRTEPDVSQEQTANENGGQTIFSYERLTSKSTDPVSGIDYKRREVCTFYCTLEKKFCFVTSFPCERAEYLL